jgi:uroporphyrinogen decarboxylase
MDRFILPYLRRWAAAVKEMGLYTILHTDGDVSACLEELAESGLDALQAIDPVAGMDMLQVKAQVGDRLCLCGNVDCGLLVMGTPEDVYAATRDLLVACKAGGGLVLGASNAVQPEVPIANYWAMIEAWRDYGEYAEVSL